MEETTKEVCDQIKGPKKKNSSVIEININRIENLDLSDATFVICSFP